MYLYLVNCTKQNAIFFFREPRRQDLWHVNVASGQQEQIGLGQDWTPEEWQKIIRQLERFGARPKEEISGPLESFQGFFWAEGLPAERDDIHVGHEAQIATADVRSVETATRSALAFGRFARESTRDRQGAKGAVVEVLGQPDPYGANPREERVEFSLTIDPEGRSDVALPGVPTRRVA